MDNVSVWWVEKVNQERIVQSAGAVEYTDCFSSECKDPTPEQVSRKCY